MELKSGLEWDHSAVETVLLAVRRARDVARASRPLSRGHLAVAIGILRGAGAGRSRESGRDARATFRDDATLPVFYTIHLRTDRSFIPGPAGELEALLEWDPQIAALATALICHPHPVYGGTMHNKVVFRAAKAALAAGLPTLRFNFRGAGKSAGTFDEGNGEREDVRAALNHLAERFPNLPIVLVGFSFGAWVGLAVGANDQRVTALVGLGLPVDSHDCSFLRQAAKPKLIIQGTHDQYGSRQRVEELYASLAQPKQIHWVEGADHFFAGHLPEVQEVLSGFLRKESSESRSA